MKPDSNAPKDPIWQSMIDEFVAHNPDISALIVAATRSLLTAQSIRGGPPDDITRGYNPTICLSWSAADEGYIEIEVTDRDFEYYGPGDTKVDVRHFPHDSATTVPIDLLTLLPM